MYPSQLCIAALDRLTTLLKAQTAIETSTALTPEQKKTMLANLTIEIDNAENACKEQCAIKFPPPPQKEPLP
jgi:hypothetical protein